MASKNPIKGYIACPTHGCGEVCTIHAVGEHKILEGGDPPKISVGSASFIRFVLVAKPTKAQVNRFKIG